MQLPDFPWDSLREAKALAEQHPGGLIDLSVGSPVDDTISSAIEGLCREANAPGYPATKGSPELVAAMVSWWKTLRNASLICPSHVLPVIGSKEMVALLPFLLGLGRKDVVVHPAISYPTYAVGAAAVGAAAVGSDDPDSWPENTRVVWINSPSNPTGAVLDVAGLRRVVEASRRLGAVIVSDECYGLLGSDDHPLAPSVLDDDVVGGNYAGVLALHSLSKQANMAGYRGAFIAGDAGIISALSEARRHLGLMVPGPIQAAMTAVLSGGDTVGDQREVYSRRRRTLRDAFHGAGWRIDHSDAGLYLWATRGESADESVMRCAKRGILVTPGHFYGPGGASHVRISLTVRDDLAGAVAGRLVP